MEDLTISEPTDMLVTRRPRRSTAGNRMEAALAEMALEAAAVKDLDDDNDFVNDKDEEDIFGSDFESTDEEAENQAVVAGETEVANEERKIKKAARSRLEKATAAAHEKHKSTFNSDIQLSSNAPKPKPKAKADQHVSMGVAVDIETGEVAQRSRKDADGNTRTSKRKHTVQNTSATVTRLKQSQAKKALQPKKTKTEYKKYTQAELIALALDTEEGNIVEHRDYLKNEAAKRKRARVVRTTVNGPLLRWISRKEEVKVEVPPPPPVAQPTLPSLYKSIYGPPGSLFTPTTYTYTAGNAMVSTVASTSTPTPQGQTNANSSTSFQPTTFSYYQHYLDSTSSAFPMWPPPPASSTQQPSYPQVAPISSSASILQFPSAPKQQTFPITNIFSQATAPAPTLTANAQPLPPPVPEYRQETVTKNYVVHELGQHKATPKPTWAENMQAMFGNHVKWDDVKVFVSKGRPLARPRQMCPITGRQAHYLDPRSGVPYADSYAYKILTDLLNHEYVWSPSLGCYLDRQSPPPGSGDKGKQATGSEDIGDAMTVDKD